MTDEKHAMVAFGANMPFFSSLPGDTILSALAELEQSGLEIVCRSRLFKTPCFPEGAGPDYVNATAVLAVPQAVSAEALLSRLHDLETRFGRRRETRWGMRTLDVDLLAIGDAVFPDHAGHFRWRTLPAEDQTRLAPTELVLPHPRLQDRAFVLVPLAEVAPDWTHPVLGQTVLQMLAALPAKDRDDVQPID